MGDYLQVWEPPAESEEQSSLGFMDHQLTTPDSDLLDVHMDQDSFWASVPEPAVRCTAGPARTSTPRPVCSRRHTDHHTDHHDGTGEKRTLASAHIPLSPPLSNSSHHPSPGRTPPVARTVVGPSYFNLYDNDNDDNALDLYMDDASSSIHGSLPSLVNDRGRLGLHHRSLSSTTSHNGTVTPSCCCQRGHTNQSTRSSSSLQHRGGVRGADEKRQDTSSHGTQHPLMHGLVLARREDLAGLDNQNTGDRREPGRRSREAFVLVRI